MIATRERLAMVGERLKATSPANAVAWAFGIGDLVLERSDDSGGRLFDLASLTKPLCTTPAVLLALRDPSELDTLEAQRLGYLGSLDDPGEPPTLRALLSHSAGLPAELPVGIDATAARGWLAAALRDRPDERRVLYSDPGFWLLGRWVESVEGRPLYDLFEDVPTTASGDFRFGSAPARDTVPAGPRDGDRQFPHDPASRTLGACGHAGAFGTLDAVIGAVAAWLHGLGSELDPDSVTCQTHDVPGGHRGLGWTLAGDPFHVVAHDWPGTTVCHSGFTGVSIALDPVSRWWAVYLSNALPIERDATPILIARRLFHAEAARRLREIAPGPGTAPAE